MNKVFLMGRPTKEPENRNTGGDNGMPIAKWDLAVDKRIVKQAGGTQNSADFIKCVAFGDTALFAEQYLRKGTKILVTGHLQTGMYTNKDGVRVYTIEVVVEDIEFCERKSSNNDVVPE